MLCITIPKRIKDSYNKKGYIITIDIYSEDDDDLLTTTCRGWNKKWHHCPHSIAHKKIRIVNNNCRTCYTEGSPLCRTCSTSSNIELTILKIDGGCFNDRYSNKLNDILCHFLIGCPEFIKK